MLAIAQGKPESYKLRDGFINYAQKAFSLCGAAYFEELTKIMDHLIQVQSISSIETSLRFANFCIDKAEEVSPLIS